MLGAFKHMDCSSSAAQLPILQAVKFKYLLLDFVKNSVAHSGQAVVSVPFFLIIPPKSGQLIGELGKEPVVFTSRNCLHCALMSCLQLTWSNPRKPLVEPMLTLSEGMWLSALLA